MHRDAMYPDGDMSKILEKLASVRRSPRVAGPPESSGDGGLR